MQTWEYAPQYALRTYAYLLPMAGLAKFYHILLDALPTSLIKQLPRLLMLPGASSTTTILGSGNKPLLFALLRSSLAVTSSYAELSFLQSIHDIISPNLAYMTAFVQLSSAGLFHANQAYLPSSSVMILWQLSVANQFQKRNGLSIFWGLLAVLAVGWPFCAVLFVSTGCWALWSAFRTATTTKSKQSPFRAVAHVLIRTLLHTIVIQSVIFAIDYYYYGRIVSPIWNIFSYNARGGGDELYGIEPLSYYIKNIALNFNVVGAFGVVAIPILLAKVLLGRYSSCDSLKILGLVPMYIWMTIVLPRPHKEERFLFPIYPMLCFGSAISVDELLNALRSILARSRPKKSDKSDGFQITSNLILGLLVLSPAAIISISRSLALHRHYTAPQALYQHAFDQILNVSAPDGEKQHVCTCGEWYRFPSSFFLHENIQLGFLKSSFEGQLPQPFTSHGSTRKSLDVQVGQFNDMNREETDRYLDISQCSYVVEMVSSSEESDNSPECLQYMRVDASSSWGKLSSFRYLDAKSTPALHRILYLPFGRESKVKYKEYIFYKREGED